MALANCGASIDCPLTVDVILQSSDGERFGAHTRNLELYTDAFPMAGLTLPPQHEEIVELSESSEILRLVLAYTHNLPPPDLSSLQLNTLLALGEAVKMKYNMHFAGECVTQEIKISEYPLEILAYKSKVSDLSLIDDAARRTMDKPLQEVMSTLDSDSFRVWIQYREEWQKLMLKYKDLVAGMASFYQPLSTQRSPTLAHVMPAILNVIGLPAVSTVRTALQVFDLAYAFQGTQAGVGKPKVFKDLIAVVNQLPQWKNFRS